MTLLSGCDKRNNREWLENKFGTELSRVYPTQNVEDLFKEFPDGFKIHQTYQKGNYFAEVDMYGDTPDKPIEGTLVVTDLSTKEEKEILSVPIRYEDNSLVFKNEEARKYWPINNFLFQYLTINRRFLSNQKMLNKEYLAENGDFGIQYELHNSIISDYLEISNESSYILELGGSNSNQGYYYSVIIRKGSDFKFRETILDTNN